MCIHVKFNNSSFVTLLKSEITSSIIKPIIHLELLHASDVMSVAHVGMHVCQCGSSLGQSWVPLLCCVAALLNSHNAPPSEVIYA